MTFQPSEKPCELGIVEKQDEYFVEHEHVCGECGKVSQWSADDISWLYEQSPFMPCGHSWDMLDRVL